MELTHLHVEPLCLLSSAASAARVPLQIGSLVNRAGISNLTGLAGETNVQARAAAGVAAAMPGQPRPQMCRPAVGWGDAAQFVTGLLSLSGFLMQGEDQKKLDVISNEVFSNCLRQCGRTGIIASEEEDQPVRAGRAVPAGHAVPAWCPGMLQKVLCRCATDVQCPEGAWMPRITPAALPPARPQVAVEETFSGEYVVVFDPLDGSSNIDAGAPALWLLTL